MGCLEEVTLLLIETVKAYFEPFLLGRKHFLFEIISEKLR